jgi:hypothetical protein
MCRQSRQWAPYFLLMSGTTDECSEQVRRGLMIKCICGREWPCEHKPESWHTPVGIRLEDIDTDPDEVEDE